MTRVTALDSIVRLLADNEDPHQLRPNETLVNFDSVNRRVVAKRTFAFFRTGLRSYLVTSGKPVKYSAPSLRLQSARGDNTLEVQVECRFECPPGQESRVVSGLADGANPESVIEKMISDAVQSFQTDFVEAKGLDPVLNFLGVQEEWESFVESHIESRTGLMVEIQFMIGEDWQDTITIEDLVNVYVDDFDEELEITFKVVLEIVDGSQPSIILGTPDSMRKGIQKSIRDHVQENYSIHQLVMSDTELKRELRDLIDRQVRSFGRRVVVFKLSVPRIGALPSLDPLSHQCFVNVKGRSQEACINYEVVLQLNNVGTYWEAEITDLGDWLRSCLDFVTRTKLVDCDVVMLTSQFDSQVRTPILEALATNVESIGCSVATFAASSDIDLTVIPPPVFDEVLDVSLNDYDQKLKTAFRVELKYTNPRDPDVRAIGNEKAIFDAIRHSVLNHLSESYLLHDFYAKPDQIKMGLRTLIEATVRDFGHDVAFFKVDLRLQRTLPDLGTPFAIQHPCKARDRKNADVELRHMVLMRVENMAALIRSQVIDVEGWCKQQLEQIVRANVFSLSLLDLMADYAPVIVPLVKSALSEQAATIGLAVVDYDSSLDCNLEELDPVLIRQKISVSVGNVPEGLSVDLDAEFLVTKQGWSRAVEAIRMQQDFRETLVHEVRQRVSEVNLHDCVYQNERVVQSLRKAIEEAASHMGRSTRINTLELEVPFDDPKLEPFDQIVSFSVDNWDDNVEIRFCFTPTVSDIGALQNSQSAAVEHWLATTLESIARQELLDLELTEVELTYENTIWPNILERLNMEAVAYGLRLLNSRSNLITTAEEDLFLGELSVIPNDSEDKFHVSYEVRIQPLSHRRGSAVRRSKALAEQVEHEIRRGVQQHGIHQCCMAPQVVKRRIRDLIDSGLQDLGRTLDYCNLDIQIPFEVPEQGQLTLESLVKIRNWHDRILVEHHVFLEVIDIAAYRRHQIQNQATWARDVVERVSKNVLFDCSYVDLVLRFEEELQGQIREEMEREAKKVGIKIRQFSSVPKVERIIRNGFNIEIDEEFTTKELSVPVNLVILVRGHFKRLDLIERHLNPTVALEDVIKEEARTAVADVLHRTTPSRFYLQFESAQDDLQGSLGGAIEGPVGPGDGIIESRQAEHRVDGGFNSDAEYPVEDVITDAINKRLKKKLGIKCASITVKQGATALQMRLERLQAHRFVSTLSVQATDGPEYQFLISYRILGVVDRGWHQFQQGGVWRQTSGNRDQDRRTPDVDMEIKDIQDFVERKVSAKFNSTLPAFAIEYRSEDHRMNMEKVVASVLGEVTHLYGLHVELTSFERKDSPGIFSEFSPRDPLTRVKAEVEHLVGIIKVLRKQELSHIEEGEYQELEAVRGQLKKYNDQLDELGSLDKLKEDHEHRLPASAHDTQSDTMLRQLFGGLPQPKGIEAAQEPAPTEPVVDDSETESVD